MRILKDLLEKIKPHKNELVSIGILVLVGFLGFGLGRLSKIEEMRPAIEIRQNLDKDVLDISEPSVSQEVYFVASKNGTKYYFPWCSGVQRISPANLVKYKSREEAEKAGLSKASNCPGL